MRASVICDFRRGCTNLESAFGPLTINAAATIQASAHLAEALVLTGLAGRRHAVDMALALQEARQCPMPSCTCAASIKANVVADAA
jgi:hypothetical protein